MCVVRTQILPKISTLSLGQKKQAGCCCFMRTDIFKMAISFTYLSPLYNRYTEGLSTVQIVGPTITLTAGPNFSVAEVLP